MSRNDKGPSRRLQAIAQCTRDLVTEWRLEAERMELRGLTEPAGVVRSMADELQAVLGRQESEILTLQEASTESDYSADHLGRLVRAGDIPNAGRPGAPRIRRRDLPKKAGGLTRPELTSTLPGSKAAIVRSIADQER